MVCCSLSGIRDFGLFSKFNRLRHSRSFWIWMVERCENDEGYRDRTTMGQGSTLGDTLGQTVGEKTSKFIVSRREIDRLTVIQYRTVVFLQI